jgi:deazaflavin-dependent oxidoreductase (nitroreductase family)
VVRSGRIIPIFELQNTPDADTVKAFNKGIVDEFRSNGGKVGGQFAAAPLLLLTTTGAKSGQPRVSPLAHLTVDGKTIIIGSYVGADINPAWVHNLRADPRAHIEVGTESFDVLARELSPNERRRSFRGSSPWLRASATTNPRPDGSSRCSDSCAARDTHHFAAAVQPRGPIAGCHVVAEQMNEDDGESGDPVSRPRRRCVGPACSRLATALALPRRRPPLHPSALPRHVGEEKPHACAADLRQIRCA